MDNKEYIDNVNSCGYQVINNKGQGSFGLVYEVGDKEGNLFAFKYLFSTDWNYIEGLDNLIEIDVLSRFHNPYIIHAEKILTPYDCDLNSVAIILPLAERSLFNLSMDRTVTTEELILIFFKLALALSFMHNNKLLHLDIKSANVVIKDGNPYFIDFGLSLYVDDVEKGIESPIEHVTIDHKPPEIIDVSEPIYNGAVDVWSFGIMMLYVLSRTKVYNVNNDDYYNRDFKGLIVSNFQNTNHIENLLADVDQTYFPLIVDLLGKILQLDPNKRLTAFQITQHPLFNDFRLKIEPATPYVINELPINYDYSDRHRDVLKILINQALNLYAGRDVILLFLAVELFNRMGSFYKQKSVFDLTILSASCLYIAAKLLNIFNRNAFNISNSYSKLVYGFESSLIIQTENYVIDKLNGVLFVKPLYDACYNVEQLKYSFKEIILAKDSTLYGRVNIPQWADLLLNELPVTNSVKKISIVDFFD